MLQNIQRLILAGIIVLLGSSVAATAQRTQNTVSQQKKAIFPDEYSELDGGTGNATVGNDQAVSMRLELARKKYLRALSYIDHGDAIAAAKSFEDALQTLNEMVSQPGIDRNQDFSDLAQSVIEDYETYIQSIDNLDENSSIFILREKLFQEVESSSVPQDAQKKPGIQPLKAAQPSERAPQAGYTASGNSIPLPVNEHVEKNLQFLTTSGRKFMKKWLERSTRWMPTLKQIAKEEGMPDEIVYLSMIESGLNPKAVSWAKAVGMWQFIKATGEENGLLINNWVDERRDPEKATRAAMKFLRHLYNEFGDWHLALAAYNCGPGGVRRAIRNSGVTENVNFWTIRESLPRETKNYVPGFIAAATIAQNPEAYGFNSADLQYEAPYAYDVFTLNENINFKALAKSAGMQLDELRDLNPELLKAAVPDKTQYRLKIPYGTREVFAANLAALTPEEKQPWQNYTVRRGETLASIASQFGIPAQELSSINDLSGQKLRHGMTLRIPSGAKAAVRPVQDEPDASAIADAGANTGNQTTENGDNSDKKYITHIIRPGETLYSVAQRYGVRLTDLRNWNNLSFDEEKVQSGSRLVVAVNGGSIAENPASIEKMSRPQIVKHKVRRGETLAQIADDFGVSVESIRNANRIGRKANLKAGQVLTINTAPSSVSQNIASAPTGDYKLHTVRRGQNIGVIAAMYGVREDDVRRWNSSDVRNDQIIAGSKLKIYTEQADKGSRKAIGREINRLPKTYKVRKGDTLDEIADKFGVSISTLKKKNKALRANRLKAGQMLTIQ